MKQLIAGLTATAAIAALATLTACTPTVREVTANSNELAIPSQLQDCQFFKMRDDNGNGYLVARCPHSTTSVQKNGKHPQRTIVIDGTEYVEKTPETK